MEQDGPEPVPCPSLATFWTHKASCPSPSRNETFLDPCQDLLAFFDPHWTEATRTDVGREKLSWIFWVAEKAEFPLWVGA